MLYTKYIGLRLISNIDISSFTIASPRLTTALRLNLFSLLVR